MQRGGSGSGDQGETNKAISNGLSTDSENEIEAKEKYRKSARKRVRIGGMREGERKETGVPSHESEGV